MTFRRFIILWQVVAVVYFVWSKPQLAKQLVMQVPVLAEQIAQNPKGLLRFVPGREDSVDYSQLQAQARQMLNADSLTGAGAAAGTDSAAAQETLKLALAKSAEADDESSSAPVVEKSFGSAPSDGASAPTTQGAPAQAASPNAPANATAPTAASPTTSAPSTSTTVSIPTGNGSSDHSKADAPSATPAPSAAQVAGTQLVNSLSSASSQGGAAREIVNEKIPTMNRKMSDYDRRLEAAYDQVDQEGPAGANVLPPPKPVEKTAVIEMERTQLTTRYLYLNLRDFSVRFSVEGHVSDVVLSSLVETFRNACLKAQGEAPCTGSGKAHATIAVDKTFYGDLKSSQVKQWSPNDGQVVAGNWRLVCEGSALECGKASSKARSFKLTSSAERGKEAVLARGFESLATREVTKHRAPASAVNHRTVQRAYFTRMTTSRTTVNDGGSL